MLMRRCPGQDTRYWTAGDIHEQDCLHCGAAIEFWKTDIRVRCPNCKQKVVNSRFDLGCAAWCAYAEQCLGAAVREMAPRPLRQILESELDRALTDPLQRKAARAKISLVEREALARQLEPLSVLTALVLLILQREAGAIDSGWFLEQLAAAHHFPAEAVEEARRLVNAVLQERREGEAAVLLMDLVDRKNKREAKLNGEASAENYQN
jgi:hypothetical protein